MRNLSRDFNRNPVNLRWAPDNSSMYFDSDDRGSRNVYFVPAGGGAVKPVTSGTHVLTFDSVSRTRLPPAP